MTPVLMMVVIRGKKMYPALFLQHVEGYQDFYHHPSSFYENELDLK